jgi:hypothetical protein
MAGTVKPTPTLSTIQVVKSLANAVATPNTHWIARYVKKAGRRPKLQIFKAKLSEIHTMVWDE